MSGRPRDVRIFPDAPALSRAAAGLVAERIRSAAGARGRAAVALAGGSTPRSVHRVLSGDAALRGSIPWDRTHLFQGDERTVPPDHPDSNWKMVRESLVDPLVAAGLLPEANLHRIEAENPDSEAAAAAYESLLRDFFRPAGDAAPRFDLILLGLGEDGHTASLFPGTEALAETRRLVAAPFVPRLGARRITLTYPVLDASACVVFLVSGAGKGEALGRILAPRPDETLPAARVNPRDGALVWMTDAAAAERLSPQEGPAGGSDAAD